MDIRHILDAMHPFLTAATASGVSFVILILALWSVAWKGIGLWVSARNYQRNWFIAMLVIETAGILPIIYLVFFRSDKKQGVTQSLFNNPAQESE